MNDCGKVLMSFASNLDVFYNRSFRIIVIEPEKTWLEVKK